MATADPTIDYGTADPNADPNAPKKVTTQPVGAPSPDPNAPAVAPASAPTSSASAMPAGMDPALAAIYQKSGLTPGDRGTGFADWQYWQEVGPSQYNRLSADIAGTGTDQPTGTPGSGPWSSSGAGQGAAAGAPAGGGLNQLGAPAAASTSPVGAATSLDGALGTPTANDLYATLSARAGESIIPNASDPIIAAQTDAFRAEQTRAARNLEAQAAEKSGSNSNQDATVRSATENAAQQTAGFQSTLMANEVAARRAEVAQALQQKQGVLTAEQQMALQQELANLDVKLRSYQFGQSQNQQESQFARTLANNAFQFDTNSQFNNSPLGS